MMFLLSGCGPAIQVQRLKPAEIDMSSMRRLAVFDFDYYRGDVDSVEDFVVGIVARSIGVHYGEDPEIREAASYATDKLIAALRDTGYFEIANAATLRGTHLRGSTDVEKIRRSLGIDAIIAASLSYAECEIETFFKGEKVWDSGRKKKGVREDPWVRQKCQLTLSYRVVRTGGNVLEINKRFTEYRVEEAEEGRRLSLHDAEYWYREMIEEIIPQIVRQLAPYVVTETRHLKMDETDDPLMERATDLAKGGSIGRARELFLQRWQSTGNPAAGYNAVILYEVEGDLTSALKLLEELIQASNDSSILREHSLVLNAVEEQRLAEEQLR